MRRIMIRYFEGCPHWRTADERVRAALGQTGVDATIGYETIATTEDATRTGFRGSPTILIDGTDAFPTGDAPPALACRIYPTPAGPQGAPTVEELIAALRSQE